MPCGAEARLDDTMLVVNINGCDTGSMRCAPPAGGVDGHVDGHVPASKGYVRRLGCV